MKNVYLEITNLCNLNCSFCHGTGREKRMMSPCEFDALTDALHGKAEYLFFHLLGEPLLHPNLTEFVRAAREKGFKPCITTNGTMLDSRGDKLAEAKPYRVSISLHAPEANGAFAGDDYLSSCIEFAKKATARGTYVAFRLWNSGGLEAGNQDIIARLRAAYTKEWTVRRSGWHIDDYTFVETGELFDWPDMNAPDYGDRIFCHGIRDQIGILADGTVVPCCLDADGCIPLGNLFETSLDEILDSPKARAMYDGFTRGFAAEELCRHCGYAALKKMH